MHLISMFPSASLSSTGLEESECDVEVDVRAFTVRAGVCATKTFLQKLSRDAGTNNFRPDL